CTSPSYCHRLRGRCQHWTWEEWFGAGSRPAVHEKHVCGRSANLRSFFLDSLPAEIRHDLAQITIADIKRVEQAVRDADVKDVDEILPVLRRTSPKLHRIAVKILNKYPTAMQTG
ncbi:hypothetical protein AAVH_16333, partial [Aphelenchoides avenae]